MTDDNFLIDLFQPRNNQPTLPSPSRFEACHKLEAASSSSLYSGAEGALSPPPHREVYRARSHKRLVYNATTDRVVLFLWRKTLLKFKIIPFKKRQSGAKHSDIAISRQHMHKL